MHIQSIRLSELVVCAQGYAMNGADDEEWGALMGTLLKQFHDIHRGFRLRRMVGQVFGVKGADIVVRSGVNPEVRLTRSVDRVGEEVVSALFAMTHEQAVAGCSALLPMFTYFPPRVLFAEPEQARTARGTGWRDGRADRQASRHHRGRGQGQADARV